MSKTPKQLSPFEQKLNNWVSDHLGRVPFVQKMLFVHHLQIMIKAGLSIVNALQILTAETSNKKLRKIIGEIKAGVESGRQLSEVLAGYPKFFPPIYVSMIAAGETAGKMEDALEQIANQMKKSHELTAKIRGALIYPAVIFVAMTGVAFEVVLFVLPKLMVMFEEFNAQLPLPTRVLIALTNFLQHYVVYLAVALIALIILAIYLLKQPKVKSVVHKFNLRLPIIGAVIKKINLARFTLTLSSLLKSAIPIVEAVGITASVQSNLTYRAALNEVSEQLKKGEPLSGILARYPQIFPPMVMEMIMVGEQTGQAEHMLLELSDYYADEVDNTMKNFSTVIEPVIILVLGLAVAGVAVAVIMPMYSLAQSF